MTDRTIVSEFSSYLLKKADISQTSICYSWSWTLGLICYFWSINTMTDWMVSNFLHTGRFKIHLNFKLWIMRRKSVHMCSKTLSVGEKPHPNYKRQIFSILPAYIWHSMWIVRRETNLPKMNTHTHTQMLVIRSPIYRLKRIYTSNDQTITHKKPNKNVKLKLSARFNIETYDGKKWVLIWISTLLIECVPDEKEASKIDTATIWWEWHFLKAHIIYEPFCKFIPKLRAIKPHTIYYFYWLTLK